jgi:hypothetical protein
LGIAHRPYALGDHYKNFKERRERPKELLDKSAVIKEDVTPEQLEIAKVILNLHTDGELYGQTLTQKEEQILQFLKELYTYLDQVIEVNNLMNHIMQIYVVIGAHDITNSLLHFHLTGSGKRLKDLTDEELYAVINPSGNMALKNCARRLYQYNPHTRTTIFKEHKFNDEQEVQKRLNEQIFN